MSEAVALPVLIGSVFAVHSMVTLAGQVSTGDVLSVMTMVWLHVLKLPQSSVAFHVLVIGPEEAYLAARFGPEYAAYRARVRRWL